MEVLRDDDGLPSCPFLGGEHIRSMPATMSMCSGWARASVHGADTEHMGGTIGTSLSGMLRLPTLPSGLTPSSGSSPAGTDGASFADQLNASFRSRAEQLGLKLPAAPTAPSPSVPGADGETVDAIWKRAQVVANANGGGIADSIMDGLDAAADKRAEQRHGRSSGMDLFGF
jgi:hypothetical protein